MKKLFFGAALVACALGLSACSTLSDAKIGKALCENQIVSRAALNLALAADSRIKDDFLRQQATAIDQAALDRLNACPAPSPTAPVPVGPSATPSAAAVGA